MNHEEFSKISKEIVEGYLSDQNWRVKENSNCTKSVGALGKHMTGEVGKNYWLNSVYNPVNPEISQAYIDGYIHIHDLGGAPTIYCCGYSLSEIIKKGVKGVPNIPSSKPARHFMSILNQLSNLTTVFQNEIMGAVAFSSVDTLLSPFIKVDNLSYKEVKQLVQNFIFSINSNSRGGAEPAFSNVTLDITPPSDLVDKPAIIAGEPQEFTYGDCQAEMDMFNRAFCELMIQGDAAGNPFAYPIPTYNIHERFDWENPNNELIWDMAGKYGYPYFANFINSDMNIEDARSMCCRLRLDLRELRRKNGGLFGSGDSTGSIGVVTINLPRIAFESKHEEKEIAIQEFYTKLEHYMDISKESLCVKRKFLQSEILDKGLLPAFQEYVGTIDNHFSTIGLVGLNEMCENLLGVSIVTPEGKQFSLDVLEFMRGKLSDYQEETHQLFNLEATPAESTCYRLAKKDKDLYGDAIVTQFNGEPYYTNSCHMPVKEVRSLQQLFDHQDELQCAFTGGTVVHMYIDGPISGSQAKSIVKSVCSNYKLPYISLSPLTTVCPEHGLLYRTADTCPTCGKETNKYQRITGYIRNIKNFNPGKSAEFKDRNQLHM